MDKSTAIHIIESLADGIDPFTDHELPQDSTIQNVQVVRALFFALSVIKSFTHGKYSDEILIDINRSEQECLWVEYCQLAKFDDPHQSQNINEEDGEVFYEYGLTNDDATYDYYEDHMNDLLQELYDDAENYARSDEEGWFYPNTEGSWEDNLSDKD